MSCEIRHIAQFLDIDRCKKWCLEKDDQNNVNWLQESLVSFSPTGEILVIARGNNLVLLTSKWDSAETEDVKMKYNITWQGNPCNKSGDITSVLCFPIFSHSQSANGADWTCIVVGFSSGTVKFYTENMHQLLSEVLHTEPILHIKCSFSRAANQQGGINLADQDSNESIYILYKTVICVVNGFSLFQTLRDCRNKLARQSASLEKLALDTGFPVDFKKYGFADQDAITDACFVGQTLVNIYDHLMTASLTGGFHCNYRPSPPQTSLIIATGRKPFLGFHFTVEGGGNAVLADVALAVASKIKESVAANLPGWFGFGSSEQEKMKIAQEPAEQLRCRFGLCDLWRHGSSIITTPDCRLSAVTDSLGRIILIENSTGIARRLWKGYRDAQCGFLEVEEDVEKSRHRKSKSRNNAVPRRTLFIVIYAPKKGLIEIFALEQGPCVASFKVSKHGLLIYTPYGSLGVNNANVKGIGASQYPVVFLSEDGIREVIVPFHCGLRSDDSNKARDLHILRKIKVYLKEEHDDDVKFDNDMKAFAKDLKTEEIKSQVIEMLMSNKQITASAFTVVLNVFMENHKAEEGGSLSRSFMSLIESLERMMAFYIFLKDLNNQPPSYKTVVQSEDNSFLVETLLLTSKEMSSISKLISDVKAMESKRKGDVKVTFAEKSEKNLTYFLSCFDFNAYIDSGLKGEEKDELDLNFKSSLKEEKMKWMGEFLFRGVFYSKEWISDWKTYISESKLNCLDLMKCLISHWHHKKKSENVISEIASLLELVKAICSFVDPDTIFIAYTKHSPWWESIRSYLKTVPCSTSGLLAALVFRAVTITFEQMKELTKAKTGKNPASESEAQNEKPKAEASQSAEWENVSQDTWEWDIMIAKLEDITLLNSVLNLRFRHFESSRPVLDFVHEELSLNLLLSKGVGYISELVAKWLVQFGLDPSSLIDRTDVEFRMQKLSPENRQSQSELNLKDVADLEEAKSVKENDISHIVLDYIRILKDKFPYSLTSSSLLGNMCWEYMAYWYRNADQLDYLALSVDYLHNIPSVNLKHGLSYLCWTTYVIHRFSAVAKLINKFGKVPKDKFCLQEVSLTNIQVPVFLKLSTEILNIMLETGTAEKNEFVSNQEGIWQNETVDNVPSLVTLSLSHPKINDELLVLHYQLSLSLYMMSELNIKVPKLFSNLFDNVAQTEFFIDFAMGSRLSGHSCNVILTNSRKQFLYKVIAGAVQTIEVVESIPPFPVAESTEYIPETCVNVNKATKWISHCFELARMWDIPLDDLRRQHVCELYSCGFDRLAEEILPAVNESSALASQLLVIAGERLKVYIHDSSSLLKRLSNLSPNLSTWLEYLDTENLKHHSADLNDLCTMLSYILKWHPEKADEERLALAMAESIPSLENDD